MKLKKKKQFEVKGIERSLPEEVLGYSEIISFGDTEVLRGVRARVIRLADVGKTFVSQQCDCST